MLKKFFLTAAILLVVWSVVALLANIIARQQDTPARVTMLLPDQTNATDCPSPCWNGINTNEISHAQTVERILSLPNAVQDGILEWDFSLDNRHIQHVRLDGGRDLIIDTQGLRLGDMIVALGISEFQVHGSAFTRTGTFSGHYISFFYPDDHMFATVLLTDGAHLSPTTPIYEIRYPAGVYPDPDSQHEWVGFVPIDAYPPRYTGSLMVFD